jgi:hypothetical protein
MARGEVNQPEVPEAVGDVPAAVEKGGAALLTLSP